MNVSTLRLRYTQFFLICLFGIFSYIMIQSHPEDTQQFEKNFWNRNFFISTFTTVKLTLGDHVFSQALLGKEGWLEYTGDGNLDDYQNAISVSPEALENTQKGLSKLYRELRKRNITLLVVIAPNKATIYPDKLPNGLQKLGQKSYLDIFSAYLKKNGPPVLLDLRPALQNGRKTQDVYYATNTHWNAYGAFIGYTEIMKALSKHYPQLAPKSMKDFDLKISTPYQHDIPRMMRAPGILETGVDLIPAKSKTTWTKLNEDTIVPMEVAITPKNQSPTLLIYMDSFGNGMKNFFPTQFRKVTFIQNTSNDADGLSLASIDTIKPNIIIIEFVERSLTNQALNSLLKKLLATEQ